MESRVVVGTAGHIDHGKTALVGALTGVDTDRLAEEKRRGITIELGFAPLDLGDVRASVVDVPGHEGFVRTMVAGSTGVDLALLVVAADEGVMPQTAEHLDILRLLGVARGVVALTKCDLAPDPAWRALVSDDVRAAIRARFDFPWPLVEVSATTGAGLDSLRSALAAEARLVPPRETRDRFRMPVDRTFALPGAGTIVTGTVWSGSVAEADRVLVLPAAIEARVRSVEVHGARAARAGPGRRAALALVGLSREQAGRGAVVVTGGGWSASRLLDVELEMLPHQPELKPRLRLRLHHGTSEVMARIAALAPGRGGRVPARLVLEEPLVARSGDRFVVRRFSPPATVGGGVVVDPAAGDLPSGRGRRRQPLPALPAQDRERVLLLVARRGPRGLAVADLEAASGLDVPRLEATLKSLVGGELLRGGEWLVASEAVAEAAEALVSVLRSFHASHPLETGMSAQAWRGACGSLRKELVELAELRLSRAGEVVRDGASMRLPGFRPGGGEAERRATEAILSDLDAADAEPPSVSELALRHPGVDVPAALRLLAREGRVVAVGSERFYESGAFARERERVVAALKAVGEAGPAAIKERVPRSRKWLIPLLEHLDREGVTERKGDLRSLRRTPLS